MFYVITKDQTIFQELIEGEVTRCILFADDIIFAKETRDEVNGNLEMCRHALQSKLF